MYNVHIQYRKKGFKWSLHVCAMLTKVSGNRNKDGQDTENCTLNIK